MTRSMIHPSTGRVVTRDAYQAITTEALLAECRALETSYEAVHAQDPGADVTVYESILSTVTEVLATRVEAGDPLAAAWYNAYDNDDDTDSETRMWADEPQQPVRAASPADVAQEREFETWGGLAALMSSLGSDHIIKSEPAHHRILKETQVVRLTVYRIGRYYAASVAGRLPVVPSTAIVRQVDVTAPRLVDAAAAAVREYVPLDRIEQLIASLGKAFAITPKTGFTSVTNIPTRLAFLAVWPNVDGAGQLAPEADW